MTEKSMKLLLSGIIAVISITVIVVVINLADERFGSGKSNIGKTACGAETTGLNSDSPAPGENTKGSLSGGTQAGKSAGNSAGKSAGNSAGKSAGDAAENDLAGPEDNGALNSSASGKEAGNSDIKFPDGADFKIENSANISGWKTLTRKDYIFETKDWNGFQRTEDKVTAVFQIDFPSEWTLQTTVFSDSKGNKLAEICPMTGLSAGQKLLENWSGDMDAQVLTDETYQTDKYQGRKVVSDLNIYGPGGGEFKFYKYYLQDGDMVFCINFYADINIDIDEKLYEKMVNSFRFL